MVRQRARLYVEPIAFDKGRPLAALRQVLVEFRCEGGREPGRDVRLAPGMEQRCENAEVVKVFHAASRQQPFLLWGDDDPWSKARTAGSPFSTNASRCFDRLRRNKTRSRPYFVKTRPKSSWRRRARFRRRRPTEAAMFLLTRGCPCKGESRCSPGKPWQPSRSDRWLLSSGDSNRAALLTPHRYRFCAGT